MSDIFCEINSSDIDLADERYKISFLENDMGSLAESLKDVGLLFPPIVRPVNNKFIVISGFNRIRAHIHIHQVHNKKILVYKTDPDTSEYQCLLKSITALAFKRQLTQAELIICTNRLYQFIDEKQISQKSSAIFNTELSARFVKDLLSVGRLPDPSLELISTGHLSFKSAKKISCFEKDTIESFLSIFSNIRASNNKQLEIIMHIMEIAARDAVKPKAVFKNPEIQAILFDKKIELVLKTALLRTCLFEQRFPTVFRVRQKTREKIASIKFGTNIKFLPPENLDSQIYSICFTAQNFDEFQKNVQTLYSAMKSKSLKEIFNP
ncbi:MAG: ParB N-terminal domain-containing protein [Desulfobacula sp.]|jgi:ParB family transcriptional regulator, chromosome partitioning protein|uniref:ParB N-terminal domain-containing protein n=1 Tax=Desulfobacula sp. TaxID=2593537 RepID=UPI001DF1064D|nr:ParB N-terminal domain-containing protein [Desulfobacula sp.]MBT3484637.1 ParB N-terminal domain-containing protein [Desulfobacula sp.]MBT3806967.1 ParB N-terminal domain-containing protein [Desulfobacula sp.]MBT4023666.1 ParB N-terminal domain-containing protein [Desulfobacula sp.]MBT4200655.1 ParB N-terminal domain-containing protein [Desulfobacula sp.]